MELPEELKERAVAVSAECVRVAGLLSDEAERVSRIDRGFTVVNNVFGVLALLTVSFNPFSSDIPKIFQDLVTIGAAAALVAGPYILSALVKDPHTRYRDYSRYIANHAGKISQLMTDVKSKNRYDKLVEAVQAADQNLTDAKTEWRSLLR